MELKTLNVLFLLQQRIFAVFGENEGRFVS